MQWAYLQFAFALAVVIGIIALIISELHKVKTAKEEQEWRHLREEAEQAWMQLRKEIIKT